jgi:hypothetical protein
MMGMGRHRAGQRGPVLISGTCRSHRHSRTTTRTHTHPHTRTHTRANSHTHTHSHTRTHRTDDAHPPPATHSPHLDGAPAPAAVEGWAGDRSEGRVFSSAAGGAGGVRLPRALAAFTRMASWGLAFSLHCPPAAPHNREGGKGSRSVHGSKTEPCITPCRPKWEAS